MDGLARTIQDLDSKSLQHIFSYLSLVDKLKLTLSHNNIFHLMEDVLREETLDVFDFQTTFSVPEAEFILTNVGKFVAKYRYSCICDEETNPEYLSLISKYCLNLEEIFLSGCEIRPNGVHSQLLAVSKHVKVLTLTKCILGNGSCSLISGLSKLETLNLEDSRLSGKDLNKLRNLVDLNLKNCRNFKMRNFIEICKSNKLRKLNIVGLKQLTHASIQILVDTQPRLETLIVGNNYWCKDYSCIFQLKGLREASLMGCYEQNVAAYLKVLTEKQKESLECLEIKFANQFTDPDDDFLEAEIIRPVCEFSNLKVLSFRNSVLLKNQQVVRITRACKHLEMLDIHGTGFRDIEIISFVEQLEHLRHLDISYCAVERTLYSRLIGTRRELGFDQQLVVYIKPKMKLESLLTSDEYTSCQHLVKLVLDPMRLNNESGILDRLQQLNTIHSQKHQYKGTFSVPDLLGNSLQKASLLDLDEDSLHHIMQYLKLTEKLTLVLINEDFCSVVEYFLRKDFVDLIEIISNFTVREARKILSRCGFLMKRLRIQNPTYHSYVEYYDLISEFCMNLEELDCSAMLDVGSLASIIRASSSTLKVVDIYHCDIDESVEVEISKASNLKTLSIKQEDIVGSHLMQLNNLVDLELAWCQQLVPEYFIAICKNNQLEKLEIRECTTLNNEAFSMLSETQRNLRELTLGGVYVATNTFILANLPSLEEIKFIETNTQEIIECLNALAQHRSAEVQCLHIRTSDIPKETMYPSLRSIILEFRNLKFLRLPNNTFVNSAYLKRIAMSCPSLEVLDLTCTAELTHEGIIYAVKYLKRLQHLNIKECEIGDMMTLYQEILKVKLQQVDAENLTLYVDANCEGFRATKEYAVMKKYVELCTECLSYTEKEICYKKKKTKSKKASPSPDFNTSSNNQDHVNILNLPANCLLKIASYLGTIDKLNLVSANSQFLDSIRSLIERMVFNVNEISQWFTLREADDLFKMCGSSIKRIAFFCYNVNYMEYLKLIQPYREHFTEIHLIDISDQADMQEHKKLFDSPLQRLKKIVFKNVVKIDTFLNLIENKDDLRVLDASFYDGDGMFINGFENLTELYLGNCGSWDSSTRDFIEICKKCRLKILNIRAFDCLTVEAFSVLIETQNECLEGLFMSCEYENDICSDVAKLSNLKRIAIHFQSKISLLQKILDKLVKYHRNDLISLEVTNRSYFLPEFVVTLNEMVHERRKKFNNLREFALNAPSAFSKSCV